MKVLIWIISAFVIILINELIGMAIGFKLGYVIVFLLISAVATALCKAFLGEDANNKKAKGKSAPPAGGPVPGGWTCPGCSANHGPNINFCDRCGTPKPAAAAPQAAPAEMTRPQPAPAENTRPQLPAYELTQPESPVPQAPPAPVQPAQPVAQVQQPQPYQPVAQVQQPRPQPNASIKFYVSSLNTEVNVTRPSFTVGRDATSDLSLARLPNAKYIARRQATFFCSGGKWYIRDENSTNGTFLNNRQIAGGTPHKLNTGDFISFAGKETLIVQDLK